MMPRGDGCAYHAHPEGGRRNLRILRLGTRPGEERPACLVLRIGPAYLRAAGADPRGWEVGVARCASTS